MYAFFLVISCLTTITQGCSLSVSADWLVNKTWCGNLINGFRTRKLELKFSSSHLDERHFGDFSAWSNKYKCKKIISADDQSVTLQLVKKSNQKEYCYNYYKLSSVAMRRSSGRDCNKLTKENMLFIDKIGIESSQRKPCSDIAEGGFKARLRHLDSSKQCMKEDIASSINSECYTHAGLYIVPYELTCLPSYYFFSSMRFFCRISWMEKGYMFTVAELAGYTDNKYWLIRTDPNPLYKEFGYTHSLIISRHFEETLEKKPKSMDAIEFSMQRDSYVINNYDLCMDTFRVCQTDDLICAKRKTKCPSKCGICERLNPRLDFFHSSLIGNWTVNNYSVSINESSIITDTGDKFDCVQFRHSSIKSGSDPNTKQYFVVNLKKNGCGPKYTCITFRKNSDETLLMKMGEPRDISLLYKDGNSSASCSENDCGLYCRSRKFDKGILRRGSLQPFFKNVSSIERVNCKFPKHIRRAKEWVVEKYSSNKAETCPIRVVFKKQRVLLNTDRNCTFKVSTYYNCYGSFIMDNNSDSMQLISAKREKQVNMRSFCVPKMNKDSDHYKFYLTKDLDCSKVLSNKLFSFRYKYNRITTSTVSTTSFVMTSPPEDNKLNTSVTEFDTDTKNSTFVIMKVAENRSFLALTSIFGAFFQFFFTCQCFK
ncbi:unnamed protein product [Dimorphilus gyrociliatus]|uniref:Uncharacterized protein n=1 Tax=Dimorphilus gyrociliatus TaxID=2664684 RepID=A0A7I8VCF8_9ANNE|nr:unnamed protein product [Dimorphilus gyrociliatus]